MRALRTEHMLYVRDYGGGKKEIFASYFGFVLPATHPDLPQQLASLEFI